MDNVEDTNKSGMVWNAIYEYAAKTYREAVLASGADCDTPVDTGKFYGPEPICKTWDDVGKQATRGFEQGLNGGIYLDEYQRWVANACANKRGRRRPSKSHGKTYGSGFHSPGRS